MAEIDPIDISSSDSDSEIVEVEGTSTAPRESLNLRKLPPWTGHSTNGRTRGYGGDNQKNQKQPGSSDNYRMSNLSMVHENDFNHFMRNGDFSQLAVNPRIANGSGAEFEKNLYEQQAFRRALPASFRPSASSTKSFNSAEQLSASKPNDIYGNAYLSAGPSSSRPYMRDRYIRGSSEAVMMHENDSRILPSSFMHGKSISSSQFSGLGEPGYRPMVGEERVGAADERLIFQAALEDIYQPKVEATVPDGLLSVSLLRHQKIALAWMLQKETRSLHCSGGILADDQGLGKTISLISLIQMQKFIESKSKSERNQRTEALNLDDDDDDNGTSSLAKVRQTDESEIKNVPEVGTSAQVKVRQTNESEIKNVPEVGTSAQVKVRETNESEIKNVPEVGTSAQVKVRQTNESEIKNVPEVGTSAQAFSGRRPAAGTLVVCPASVLRQWGGELDDKVASEAKLSYLIYHGGSRTKDPVELAKYDVVLTTYSIVSIEVPKQPLVDEDEVEEKDGEKYGLSSNFSADYKKKKKPSVNKKRKKGKRGIDSSSVDSGPLARVSWSRVILDEAQTIKNHRTQVARACCSLRAKKRWCLSGTPIQNAVDDLYSYFRFLRYEPYNTYKNFYHTLKLPISRNSLDGYKKLQAVLRAIMLRRTKGTLINGEPIIRLPPKSIRLTKVNFSIEERAFYTRLEADSRSKFKAYAAAGTVNQNYANILLMLLRLRQACDHPLLVKGVSSDSFDKESAEMAKRLPREMVFDLLGLLKNLAYCFICHDTPEDPVVTMCGHVFCYPCISEYLTGDDNMCPALNCKEQLGSDIIFSEATLRRCISDDPHSSPTRSKLEENSVVLQNDYTSSKIRAVLEIIHSLGNVQSSISELNGSEICNGTSGAFPNEASEGPMKAIVFSQWTGMLDLVESSLNQYCIQYRRLDGTMTLGSRDRAVKDFNADPEVTVMLMSLKAGNLGLNMVAACHVILLDLWWNPTTEDQAVDRAHRIGQTRPVTVTRLTIKDTVEDRILALQEEKRKMVASAFGEDQTGGSATRLTAEDLKYLFKL